MFGMKKLDAFLVTALISYDLFGHADAGA